MRCGAGRAASRGWGGGDDGYQWQSNEELGIEQNSHKPFGGGGGGGVPSLARLAMVSTTRAEHKRDGRPGPPAVATNRAQARIGANYVSCLLLLRSYL